MITSEDIDRIKYPEIGSRLIIDCTEFDLIKDMTKYTSDKLKQVKRHTADLLFLVVYFS